MDQLRNRLAYLQGMADGLGMTTETKEGRIIVEMMDLMDEMVISMATMQDRIDEHEEYIEAIDEDLADVEEYVEAIDEDLDDVEDFLFDEDLEDEYEYEYELDDEDDEDTDLIYFEDDDEDDEVVYVDGVYDELDETSGYDDDDTGYFDVECPNCQELVSIDQDIFEDDLVAEVLCPECHEVILVNDDLEGMDEFENYVIDEA